MAARKLAWLLAVLLLAAAALAYGQTTVRFDQPGWTRPVLSFLLGASGLAAVFLSPATGRARGVVVYLWIPAVLVRLLLLSAAPSDDLNRYLWEGKLLRAGINPYAQTADAPELEPYRDRFWEGMNHRDKPTAYPPLAIKAFAVIGAAAYHPLAYKAAFMLADLLALGGILALLRRRGMSPAFAGFYAFNPMVLLAFAAEAHFDALLVAPLVWAVWAVESGRARTAVALASLAAGIKWITLPLLPFFGGRRMVPAAVVGAVVLGAPFLFIPGGAGGLFAGLLEFGTTRSFNGPVHALLLDGAGLPRPVCGALLAAAFAGVLLWRWRVRDEAAAASHLLWILGALLVLSPTVHFWYLTWIVPLVCLRPSLPWLTFSLTGGVYFLVWNNAAGPDGWGLGPGQTALFWGPFFAACAYELWSTRGRCLFPRRRAGAGDGSVGVVIPVLDAADTVSTALDSVAAQKIPAAEVLVVDGGSTDGTRQLARTHPVGARVVEADPGRGHQIAAGIAAATSDWVVVLHADAELAPGAIGALVRAAAADPAMTGGAFGQRFAGTTPELLPIEVLNDLRALFTRTAFGDQTQFFHRATALARDTMPRQPLMEDVEASWRLRETGGFVFLGRPCRVCHRKWTPRDWLRRFSLVLRLVARYRWARLRGAKAAERLSSKLYYEYYEGRK